MSDISRTNGGFTVSASFVPTLAAPISAVVAVSLHDVSVGSVTVPAVDGYVVYRHAALYVREYADALTVRGESCEQ